MIGALMLNFAVQRFFIWYPIVGHILQPIMYADPMSQPIMNKNASLLAPISTDQLSVMIIKTRSLG
jgi:hypothetical protein